MERRVVEERRGRHRLGRDGLRPAARFVVHRLGKRRSLGAENPECSSSDNLLASSIIALRPDTGEYVWHYQENPGDEWDYDSAEQIILADLRIDGQLRQVLLHAPKNGFFYVLDRATGKLLSAKPFVPVTWASGIDLQTGRPIESLEAQYEASNKVSVVSPGPGGAHSWQAISYSPKTGLVYFPVL